jgi:hypothetical protein
MATNGAMRRTSPGASDSSSMRSSKMTRLRSKPICRRHSGRRPIPSSVRCKRRSPPRPMRWTAIWSSTAPAGTISFARSQAPPRSSTPCGGPDPGLRSPRRPTLRASRAAPGGGSPRPPPAARSSPGRAGRRTSPSCGPAHSSAGRSRIPGCSISLTRCRARGSMSRHWSISSIFSIGARRRRLASCTR